LEGAVAKKNPAEVGRAKAGKMNKTRPVCIFERLRGWLCTATGFAQCTTIKSGK